MPKALPPKTVPPLRFCKRRDKSRKSRASSTKRAIMAASPRAARRALFSAAALSASALSRSARAVAASCSAVISACDCRSIRARKAANSVKRSRKSSARLCILGTIEAITKAPCTAPSASSACTAKAGAGCFCMACNPARSLAKAARSCCSASSSWLSLTANSERRSSKRSRSASIFCKSRASAMVRFCSALCCACRACASACNSARRLLRFSISLFSASSLSPVPDCCAQAGAAKIKKPMIKARLISVAMIRVSAQNGNGAP